MAIPICSPATDNGFSSVDVRSITDHRSRVDDHVPRSSCERMKSRYGCFHSLSNQCFHFPHAEIAQTLLLCFNRLRRLDSFYSTVRRFQRVPPSRSQSVDHNRRFGCDGGWLAQALKQGLSTIPQITSNFLVFYLIPFPPPIETYIVEHCITYTTAP